LPRRLPVGACAQPSQTAVNRTMVNKDFRIDPL
jgi:hypothetical protein